MQVPLGPCTRWNILSNKLLDDVNKFDRKAIEEQAKRLNL